MAANQEKKKRTQALSNFTRNINVLHSLLDDTAPSVLVNPQFEKVRNCWEKLELAHDDFIAATDIDIEAEKDGIAFMNGPDERHQDVLRRYSAYLKTDAERAQIVQQNNADEDRAMAEENRKRIEVETRATEDLKYQEDLKKRFNSEKAELDSSIDTFIRLTLCLKDSLADASDVDKSREWQRIESEFSLLKNKMIQVVGIDHSQDVTEIS